MRVEITADDIGFARQIGREVARRHHIVWSAAEDLEQEAVMGMLEAARRWDPDKGVAFRIYASRRARGAAVDYLREREFAVRAPSGQKVSLEYLDAPADAGEPAPSHLPAGWDPERWLKDWTVRQAVGRLRPLLGHVVSEHHFCDRALAEVGAELGVSESRVSQLLAEAYAQLRRWLDPGCPSRRELQARTHDERTRELLALRRGNRARDAYRQAHVDSAEVSRRIREDRYFAREWHRWDLRRVRSSERRRLALARWARWQGSETRFCAAHGIPRSTWKEWKKDRGFAAAVAARKRLG